MRLVSVTSQLLNSEHLQKGRLNPPSNILCWSLCIYIQWVQKTWQSEGTQYSNLTFIFVGFLYPFSSLYWVIQKECSFSSLRIRHSLLPKCEKDSFLRLGRHLFRTWIIKNVVFLVCLRDILFESTSILFSYFQGVQNLF